MESGSNLMVMVTVISTGVAVIVALFAFGVFFLRRLDTVARDLRTEIQGLRTEMRTEIQGLRTEMQTEIQGLRTEMRAEFQNVRTEIRAEVQNVRTDLGPRIDGVNGRVDQMILAMGMPAFQQAAAKPAGRTEKRPPAA